MWFSSTLLELRATTLNTNIQPILEFGPSFTFSEQKASPLTTNIQSLLKSSPPSILSEPRASTKTQTFNHARIWPAFYPLGTESFNFKHKHNIQPLLEFGPLSILLEPKASTLNYNMASLYPLGTEPQPKY